MSPKPRISARRREFIAMGLRLVPSNPGPDFLRIPYACDVRPTHCATCTCSCTQDVDPRKP